MTTIDLKDAGVYFGEFLAGQREKAIQGVRLAAVRGLNTVVTVIIPSRDPTPVDRGIYRAGYKVGMIPEGATVYNDSPAAAIIEGGVRASNIKIGRKLINALAQWIIRKGIVKRGKGAADAITEARSIAWAIAKKAKAGKGFHNQRPGGGLQIQAQLNRDFIKQYVREEVMRALGF